MECFVHLSFIVLGPAPAGTSLLWEIEIPSFTLVAAAKTLPLRPVFTKTMIILDTCEIKEPHLHLNTVYVHE